MTSTAPTNHPPSFRLRDAGIGLGFYSLRSRIHPSFLLFSSITNQLIQGSLQPTRRISLHSPSTKHNHFNHALHSLNLPPHHKDVQTVRGLRRSPDGRPGPALPRRGPHPG